MAMIRANGDDGRAAKNADVDAKRDEKYDRTDT
jgi:hypothetical protein